MGIKKINAAFATKIMADNQMDADEVDDAVTAMLAGDFDDGHMKTGYTLPATQATALSSPVLGKMRVDTGTNPPTVRVYDGTNEVAPGGDHATVKPSTTVQGSRWWDSTLKLWRVYKTMNGISGWHPDPPYMLVQYSGGTGLSVGQTCYNLGSSPIRVGNSFDATAIDTPGWLPMPNLSGIVLEAGVDAGDEMIIATPSSGVVVDVNTLASPVPSVHDLIVSNLAGPRSQGPETLFTGPAGFDAETYQFMQHGYPAGAFGRALNARDATTGLQRVEFLGWIGTGRYVSLPTTPTSIATRASFTFDDNPHDLAIPTTGFYTTKHLPYAVRVQFEWNADTTLPSDTTITFSRTSDFQSSADEEIAITMSDPSAAGNEHLHTMIFDLPTNSGVETETQSAASGHGLFITYSGPIAVTAPATMFNVLNVKLIGYWI